MPRVKPTEIRLVADLLQKPAEDADELSELIIRSLDEKRMSDSCFVLGTMIGDIPLLWGPFATANQASKAASKLTSPGPEPLKGRVMRVKRIEDEST